MRTILSMETGAVRDPNLASVQMGNNIFSIWRDILADRMPWMCKMFNIGLLDPKGTSYFLSLISDEIERRDRTQEYPMDILGIFLKYFHKQHSKNWINIPIIVNVRQIIGFWHKYRTFKTLLLAAGFLFLKFLKFYIIQSFIYLFTLKSKPIAFYDLNLI